MMQRGGRTDKRAMMSLRIRGKRRRIRKTKKMNRRLMRNQPARRRGSTRGRTRGRSMDQEATDKSEY